MTPVVRPLTAWVAKYFALAAEYRRSTEAFMRYLPVVVPAETETNWGYKKKNPISALCPTSRVWILLIPLVILHDRAKKKMLLLSAFCLGRSLKPQVRGIGNTNRICHCCSLRNKKNEANGSISGRHKTFNDRDMFLRH